MKFRAESEIWPVLNETELKGLAEDIDKNGLLYPISVYKGDILDGRNRYLAITKFCKKSSTRFEQVNPESPINFVLSRNEQRRHMTESQRGLVAAKALPFFEKEAKDRQLKGVSLDGKAGGRGRKTSGPIGPKVIDNRARDAAARAFSSSPRNVQRGKAVLTHGSQKLQDAVTSGELSLGKAEEIVKTSRDKKQQDIRVETVKKSKMVTRVKGLTGEIEWYTPKKYLDAAIKVMGGIDLDPASSDTAQKHVKAKNYFTLKHDGLKQKWFGRVFLNPPYAMPFIKEFVKKMTESYLNEEFKEGILLTNTAGDTEWFHKALKISSAFCLTRGRISFLESSNGELFEKGSPTHGQTFFYFGKNHLKFNDVFSEFGSIGKKYLG